MESSAESVLRFKITGEQSIDRMAPLTVEAAATYFQHQVEQILDNAPLWLYKSSWKKTGDRLIGSGFLATPWSLQVLLDLEEEALMNNKFDFIWETTCEKSHRIQHSSATVVNKLHNSRILESKSNLAFLQVIMRDNMEHSSTKVDVLDTVIAQSSTDVLLWCQAIWMINSERTHRSYSDSWWAIKASQGNGGRDVWIVNKDNYAQVIAELPESEEYVIQ
eukprot:gene36336-48939_t